jgi:hypothetical protein
MDSPTKTEQYLDEAVDQLHKLRRKFRILRSFVEMKCGKEVLVELSEYMKEREADG